MYTVPRIWGWRRRLILYPPGHPNGLDLFRYPAAFAAGCSYQSTRFLFSFNCYAILRLWFNAQALRGMSLWQRLFLRSFCRRRLKIYAIGDLTGGDKATRYFTKNAKAVQKKTAGSWLGGGSYIDAHMGALLLIAGGG